MRAIDGDAIVPKLEGKFNQDMVRYAPTLDYKELVPQGKWEKTLTLSHDCREVISVYKCSICNALKGEKTSFCPNCGAKMLNN